MRFGEVIMERVRRLHLESVYNIRDLGGYFTNNNTITKWNLLLRSADLADINERDRDILYEYGVRTIINLKEPGETPNPIESDKRFCYIQAPLVDDFQRMFSIIKDYNGSFYLTMIEAFKENIRQIMALISLHIGNGGILFHCVSGKDRTGIISALLLLLNGVSELDVLTDFISSAIYLRPVADKENKTYEKILKYPEEIESVIEYINCTYGGAEGYLKSIGVHNADMEKIKAFLG